jgi:hypothetical protein
MADAVVDYGEASAQLFDVSKKLYEGKPITDKEATLAATILYLELAMRPIGTPNIYKFLNIDKRNEYNQDIDMIKYLKSEDWGGYYNDILIPECTDKEGNIDNRRLKTLATERYKQFAYLKDIGIGNRIANRVLFQYSNDKSQMLQYLKNEKKSIGSELFNKKIEPLRDGRSKYNAETGENIAINPPIPIEIQDEIDSYNP